MTEPARTEIVTIATSDLCGVTRGRSVAAAKLERIAAQGVGWVPANSSLTPFDVIADPNPWGSRGDLRLIPDLAAGYRVASSRAPTPFHLVMADITDLDGAPWEGCPRAILKRTLADFAAETGLTVLSAFEQEFQIVGASWRPAPAFSLQALRRCDPFAPELMAALDEAGVEPEVFLPEYGRDQFEVSCGPALGEASADRAVAMREITREVARTQWIDGDLRAEDQRRGGWERRPSSPVVPRQERRSGAVRRRPPWTAFVAWRRLLRRRPGAPPGDHGSHRAKRRLLPASSASPLERCLDLAWRTRPRGDATDLPHFAARGSERGPAIQCRISRCGCDCLSASRSCRSDARRARRGARWPCVAADRGYRPGRDERRGARPSRPAPFAAELAGGVVRHGERQGRQRLVFGRPA